MINKTDENGIFGYENSKQKKNEQTGSSEKMKQVQSGDEKAIISEQEAESLLKQLEQNETSNENTIDNPNGNQTIDKKTDKGTDTLEAGKKEKRNVCITLKELDQYNENGVPFGERDQIKSHLQQIFKKDEEKVYMVDFNEDKLQITDHLDMEIKQIKIKK